MKELLDLLIKSIVDEPDAVVITEREDEDGLILDVKVSSNDIGRVIGKQGRTANAIRTIVKANAMKNNSKVFVHILDD